MREACSVLICTKSVLKIMDAGYCLYVHIFMKKLSHLNHLILTILINSCQTSGFSKVGAIIKYNIVHFPVLIKTVLKLVYIICTARITSGKLFHMLTIRLVKQYFRKSNLHLITVSFRLLPLVWRCPMVAISNWSVTCSSYNPDSSL